MQVNDEDVNIRDGEGEDRMWRNGSREHVLVVYWCRGKLGDIRDYGKEV